MNTDLKIVFAGPPQSGKTEIADILADASKGFQGDCRPTFCVRILEFSATIDVNSLQRTVSAQIWDTSGDEKYRAAWPAIAYNADGVVLVYNAFDTSQARQMEAYVKAFASNVANSQIMIVANKKSDGERPVKPRVQNLEKMQLVIADPKESLEDFFESFNQFLGRVQEAKLRKIENRERELVGEQHRADADEEA